MIDWSFLDTKDFRIPWSILGAEFYIETMIAGFNHWMVGIVVGWLATVAWMVSVFACMARPTILAERKRKEKWQQWLDFKAELDDPDTHP